MCEKGSCNEVMVVVVVGGNGSRWGFCSIDMGGRGSCILVYLCVLDPGWSQRPLRR